MMGWRRLLWASMALVMTMGVLVACTPAAPTPGRGAQSAPPTATGPARVITVRVTLTPTITPTITPTATLPYDITGAQGTWQIDLQYHLAGELDFFDVRFFGSATMEIGPRGEVVSGTMELFPAVLQPPCASAVLSAEPLRATLTGELRPDAQGMAVASLTIVPENPKQTTRLQYFCNGFTEPFIAERDMLWSALRASGYLGFDLPLQNGARMKFAADLFGPSGGVLFGVFSGEMTARR